MSRRMCVCLFAHIRNTRDDLSTFSIHFNESFNVIRVKVKEEH